MQVAVVGATSLVGQSILELLAVRGFPAERVVAVDVPEREGETVAYGNRELDVRAVDSFGFDEIALALFAAGSDIARAHVPQARAAGAAVVDFSAAFRHDPEVPLVAPSVNAAELEGLAEAALVAVPNCTVIPLAQALQALRPLGLQRVTVSTYQSVSGSGQAAMEELANQTTALFSQRDAEVTVFPKRIAYNVLPLIGDRNAEGISDEEQSVIDETRRLLGQPELPVFATCVRVPTFFGHGWSVTVDLEKGVDAGRAALLLQAAGIKVRDEKTADGFVTPMEATGNDVVWASRIRRQGNTLAFWLTADNVRTSAALPVVAIAETLLKNGYFAVR